jgi:hypothetical protein
MFGLNFGEKKKTTDKAVKKTRAKKVKKVRDLEQERIMTDKLIEEFKIWEVQNESKKLTI